MKPRDVAIPSPPATSPRLPSALAAPRVIAITSGCQGVGQSVVVVLLGLALSRLGKKVLLLDGALGRAALPRLLGLTPVFGITDVLAGRQTLADIIIKSPQGLDVLPLAPNQGGQGELGPEDKLFLLQELELCTGDYDFLLVDTGAGLASHVLYFNMGAQERIVVATEEPASIVNAYSLIKVLATRHAEKRFQVLFTRVSSPEIARHCFEQLVKVAERFLHGTVALGYLGTVPFDAAVVEAILQQRPLVTLAALSPAGCACSRLAQHLLAQEIQPAMDGNLKFFWQSLHKKAASACYQGGYHAG